jgi:hypothetical protein
LVIKRFNWLSCALATSGTVEGNTPYKTLWSSKVIENIFRDYSAQAKKSERTIIVGAGPIRVGVTSELGFEYIRQKEIILVSSRRLEPLFIELCCHVTLC